jgi:hypothetical protein
MPTRKVELEVEALDGFGVEHHQDFYLLVIVDGWHGISTGWQPVGNQSHDPLTTWRIRGSNP